MSKQIEIKIDSEKLTPDQFIDACKAFLSVVQGVGKNISGHLLAWTVEVEHGSAVLRAVGAEDSRDYEASTAAISQGLNSLRSGLRQMPYGFTKTEMKCLKTLASLREADGMRDISIKNGSDYEGVSQNIIPLIDAIIAKEKHGEYGSIEGIVVNISLRQGFICTVEDPIEKREIICYLQNQESQDAVFRAASKRARILADGQIHYSEDDTPVSITADYVRVFRDESELPSVEDIQAIYRAHK